MVKTLRDHLVDCLEELEASQLKKFKRKLNEVDLEEGFDNIPRGQLENADPLDIADLLISFYREEYGSRITMNILESINEKKVAEKLKKALQGGSQTSTSSGASGQSQTSGASAGAGNAAGQHFVDKHRIALIKRVIMVDPILDVLRSEELLNDEKYDTVRSRPTPQEKMRKLYEYMRSWGLCEKDILFKALKDNDLPLIKDLGGV
ncbi:apoptosis-associated speck-like protein containing a CARD [Microcaecilia unicolor]|uniref:Apoptosis-associated speck-like protein containing a CARD n=1 Tax=Microcaecilia unicolor TaxID=1415580 RepID=A0A6P7YDA0_9AMPH|nr:apoptosis-associated speck-like protein containing a CARD [Microcaecilia unicolor]